MVVEVQENALVEKETNESVKKLCKRRDTYFRTVLEAVAPVVKSWYLKTSLSFLKDRQLKEEEEELFADFTDYCTEQLDEISKHSIRLKNRDFSEEHQG